MKEMKRNCFVSTCRDLKLKIEFENNKEIRVCVIFNIKYLNKNT